MKSLLRISAPRATPAPFICSSCRSSTRRFASTRAAASPPPPPPAGLAQLTNRHLISVTGVDAPKFLNGLITASVYGRGASGDASQQQDPRRDGFYSGVLTAQGRVLHDVFIYPDLQLLGVGGEEAARRALQPGQAFILEVDAERADALMLLIRRYKLRSAVTHRRLSPEECTVWSYWDEPGSTGGPGESRDGLLVAADSRAPGMGYRLVARSSGSPPVDGAEPSTLGAYTIRRMLRGVPEGGREIRPDKALPMDSNMDLMGGIDFRKGCYVGQELTIRTKHRGVVRKRMLPCVLYGEGEDAPQELAYKPTPEGSFGAAEVPSETEVIPVGQERARRVANWVDGVGNIGLAMCRLTSMTDIVLPGEPVDVRFDPTQEFMFKWKADAEAGEAPQAKSLRVKAFVPEWMRQKLGESNTNGSH